MRTMILREPGRFELADTPGPEPAGLATGEALVRVRRVGICGTDLHAFRGRQPFFSYPRILGHELGVEVLEVGPDGQDAGIRAGDRCAVEPYLHCGRCIACRRGKPNCCVDLRVLGVHTDGGLRERIVVPTAKLHRSDRLSLEQLALVETLGIGAHAVDRARLEEGEFALVIGAGPIGLSVVTFALAARARVIVMDVDAARLAFCRKHLGVSQTIDALDGPLEALQNLTSGDLPTAVFDATGNAQSMRQAFEFVAHGGRLVFVGLFQGDVTFHDPHFHRRELSLLASRNATPGDFQRIIAMLEAGTVDTAPWVSQRAPLEGLIERFPAWTDPASGIIKAMVEL